MLHKLWSWAVGKEGYDKEAWMELQKELDRGKRAVEVAKRLEAAAAEFMNFSYNPSSLNPHHHNAYYKRRNDLLEARKEALEL
jgi:hypothetical protein